MSALPEFDKPIRDYEPSDLGLDPKLFPKFRPIQYEACEFQTSNQKRFTGLVLSGGSGKSLISWMLARLPVPQLPKPKRTIILTSTIGLGLQYINDYSNAGMVEIKGRSNYTCSDMQHLSCLEGQKVGCKYKGPACTYGGWKEEAKSAQVVVCNYKYWLTVNDKAHGLQRSGRGEFEEGSNKPELLVLDEAALADIELADYLGFRLSESELKFGLGVEVGGEAPANDRLEDWIEFVHRTYDDLKADVRTAGMEVQHLGRRAKKEDLHRLHRLEGLLGKFDKILDSEGVEDSGWVCEYQSKTRYSRVWSWDVIWPGRYAEKYLFCGVPRVVLMSATLRHTTFRQLGVARDKYELKEWRRVFQASRNPVFLVPARRPDGTAIRIQHNTRHEDLLLWVEWIDQIMDEWANEKGLIQTVSYERQQFILKYSRHAEYMVGNTGEPDSDTAMEAAEKYRKRDGHAVLISPSFSTGWNFPDKQCEFIIIPKIPFKPMISKVMKERVKRDKEYGPYLTIQDLCQSGWRGMRSERDRCAVYITDEHASWFLNKYEHLAPVGWVKDVRRVREIPRNLPKL